MIWYQNHNLPDNAFSQSLTWSAGLELYYASGYSGMFDWKFSKGKLICVQGADSSQQFTEACPY